jgi:CO/xanthine dehydrogenase Mo-binding subunit
VVLRLRPSGDVEVRYGVPDQGVGMSTMLRQVVAEALGLTIEQVSAVPSDTDTVPYDAGAGASRHTYIAGRAGLKAAEELAGHLSAAAAALLDAAPETVQRQNGEFRADGRAVAYAAAAERAARDAGGHLDVQAEVNMPYPDQTCFSAQVAEVEVDPETGQVHLRKLVAIHDVGTVINPLTHQGQIDGGVMQGVGEAMIEEMIIEDGRVTTANLGEYKLPTMADIPPLETVLVDAGSGPGPFESKAIGESSLLPTPAAVANAVFDACGVRLFSLPVTAEKVWRALREQESAGERD